VALCLAISEVVQNPRGRSGLELAAEFIPGTLFLTYIAAVAVGIFSLLFAIVTQLSLEWVYDRVGSPRAIVHLLISAALGAALFPTLYPLVERLQGTEGMLALVADHDLVLAAGIGALGGAAVGSVWQWLVFSKLTSLV
jgi:hypothetical protein